MGRDSVIASGAGKILVKNVSALEEQQAMDRKTGAGPGANMIYQHLLPFGTITENKKDTAVGRVAGQLYPSNANTTLQITQETTSNPTAVDYSLPSPEEDAEDEVCCGNIKWCHNLQGFDLAVMAPTSVQKVEPKLFLANERTYLHWLHAGVILSTIAASILAFSSDDEEGEISPLGKYTHWYAMALLPLSLAFCLYALNVFLWRADRIKSRIPGRWDDPKGPLFLGGCLVFVLCINFCIKVYEIIRYY